MIVIKDSLRSATPLREAQGMYTFGYTLFFPASETVRLGVGRLPTPTGGKSKKYLRVDALCVCLDFSYIKEFLRIPLLSS